MGQTNITAKVYPGYAVKRVLGELLPMTWYTDWIGGHPATGEQKGMVKFKLDEKWFPISYDSTYFNLLTRQRIQMEQGEDFSLLLQDPEEYELPENDFPPLSKYLTFLPAGTDISGIMLDPGVFYLRFDENVMNNYNAGELWHVQWRFQLTVLIKL